MRLIDAEKAKFFIADVLDIFKVPVGDRMANRLLEVVDALPTVEAAPAAQNPCGFCGEFDFSGAKATIDRHGAHIKLACAATKYPVHEQFNFCPVCGRNLRGGAEDG